MRLARLLGTGLLALACSACAPTGFIYSNVTVPLDVNFDATQFHRPDDELDVKRIWYYFQIDWGDNSIGTIAKENGFETVHYADLRTMRILIFWRQQFVTIYGVQSTP